MCLENVTEMEYLNEDTYFYKVVKRVGSNNKEKYESAMGSHLRMLQPGAVSEGIVFNYFLGKMVSSFFSTTPGFYCFKEFKYAFKYLTLGYDLKRECILKVLVKKGTKVKYGNCLSVKYWGKEWQYTHLESVLVEELTPVEVCTSDI